MLAVSADNAALSKAQKEFNRLTKRIAKLEQDVHDFRDAATRLRQRVQDEYRPLQARHNEVRADLVRLFDRALDTYKLTKGETQQNCGPAICTTATTCSTRGHADLQPIFDKHAPPAPTAEEEAAADQDISEAMKQLFSHAFRYRV